MIEIEVGDKVSNERRPKDCYILNLSVYHGDADHYDDVSTHGSFDEIMPYLKTIDAYFNMHANAAEDSDFLNKSIINSVGEQPFEMLADLIGYDKVYCIDNRLTRIDTVSLFWADHTGELFFCKVSNMRTEFLR